MATDKKEAPVVETFYFPVENEKQQGKATPQTYYQSLALEEAGITR